jgi:hypothetical protein
VCLNVDGRLLGAQQTASFGGLIRNSAGVVIKGFYGVVSHESVLFVEIVAVLHGLDLCCETGFRNIVCFFYSLQVVTLFKNGVSPHHSIANGIQSIQHLIGRDWNVVINHILRDDNACADCLAKT